MQKKAKNSTQNNLRTNACPISEAIIQHQN